MSKYHILVVDDNPHAVTLVSIVLSKKLDCEISVAFDGSSAIKKAMDIIPDLILMDWQMPGIDGVRAVKLLKEDAATTDIPVIMLTCYSEKDYLEQAFEAGVVDFIRKPYEQIELVARVRSALKTCDYYKQSMEAQKRETSALSIQSAQNEEFRRKCINELKRLKTVCRENPETVEKEIDSVIRNLGTDGNSGTWNQVEKKIKDNDQEFFKNISEKHPNLTPAELKLCLLLRMNLSTKEIAGLMFQTYDSVRIARTRLRKKLNLSGEENLVSYICSF